MAAFEGRLEILQKLRECANKNIKTEEKNNFKTQIMEEERFIIFHNFVLVILYMHTVTQLL